MTQRSRAATEPDADALAAARCCVDGGEEPARSVGRLELAWALKHQCYAAWNSEPARAVRCAEVLEGLGTQDLPVHEALQVEALAQWTMGLALVVRSQMTQAVHAFDRAHALFTQAGDPDAAAQTRVPKIMALSMLGQPEQATVCAQEAQATLLALGNVAAASRVGLNLGNLLLRRDAYTEASRYFRQAGVLFARLGDHLNSILADIGLAGALTSSGDFEEALRIYARVRMRAANKDLAHPLAVVDEAVALLDLARGHYGEALAGLESARRRYEALGLPHALAIAEKQLADAYLDLRLLPEALALFDAAVDKFGQLEMPEEQAWALAQRGRALTWLGRVSAARASFAAAAELFGSSEHTVGLSSVTLALAELALNEGDSQQALMHAHAAKNGFVASCHADGQARAEVIRAHALWQSGEAVDANEAFTSTLLVARQRQQLHVQVRCLSGIGSIASAGGDWQAGEQALEAAIELLEDQRRALPGDDLRSAFLTEHLRPYEERLRLALDREDPSQVLVQLERYRARSLAERLDDGAGEPHTGPHTDNDLDLRERLTWLQHRVQRLRDESESSPALEDELLRAERELLERARRRRLAYAPSAADETSVFSAAALQAALKPSDALVEYGVSGKELFALVVTRERVVLCRQVADWSAVAQAIQSARFQIDTMRHGVAPVQAHVATINRRIQTRFDLLHGLIWAPLEDVLSGIQRVIVVPHAQMAALPFNALRSTTARDPEGAVETAVRTGLSEFAIVPSARAALRGILRQPVTGGIALAMGESSRLPHAEHEVNFVAGLFQAGQALVGEQATLAAFKSQAPLADVVHLACHAQFRDDNPRFSSLQLHDGALSAETIESMHLRGGIVVLSACDTGLSDARGGGEMEGLVRAFLVAGAARVLATLWPVDDASSAAFVGHFYRAWVAGQRPALALQHAQARLRDSNPTSYVWAAFTLYGGW